MRFGRCAIVRFRFAAVAAFLTLRRAAVRCFALAIVPSLGCLSAIANLTTNALPALRRKAISSTALTNDIMAKTVEART